MVVVVVMAREFGLGKGGFYSEFEFAFVGVGFVVVDVVIVVAETAVGFVFVGP